ncbi:hypothetical protein EAH86_04455 [Pedococcus bigeumensis]|uniref:Uncharacterized protein n=1 Tax=Pedococcus bigeumensis TaxID=433644 RepID=A0A502D1Q7_9MICO|nr:hypothetical protein EAH86_04455 [Pedococcus bigeumensis]
MDRAVQLLAGHAVRDPRLRELGLLRRQPRAAALTGVERAGVPTVAARRGTAARRVATPVTPVTPVTTRATSGTATRGAFSARRAGAVTAWARGPTTSTGSAGGATTTTRRGTTVLATSA